MGRMAERVSAAVARAAAGLGGEAGRGDAEELCSRLLELSRPELVRSGARELTAEESGRLDGWIARRRAGEPVQYITGRAAFRDLDLHVSRAVLIPRPETEGLVEEILRVLRA